MKKIGLIGGMGPESTLDYYRSIIDSFKTGEGELNYPEIIIYSVNISEFLNLMKAIKHQTQFIIITHNYKTMEVADYIYGTTMEEPNITKVYSVRMERKESLELEGTNGEVLNDGQPVQNPPEEK